MKYDIKTTRGDILGHIELADGLEVVAQAAAAPAAPPAPPQMREVKTMTEAAGTFSYEDYVAQGWNDNALVARGLMKIEMHPVEEAPAGEVHPDVAEQSLPQDWQPVPPPPVPQAAQEVPEPPQATPEPPAAPEVPTPPPAASEPPAAPSVPTPPPAPGVPTPPAGDSSQEAGSEGGDGLPEGLSRVDGQMPRVEGREFMIRGTSYENVVDKEGVPFDARIHGVTSDNVPAAKKDGTFKKKRGLGDDEYQQIRAQLLQVATGDAPPADQAPGAVPPPPSAPAAPQAPTAPEVPTAPPAPGAPTPPGAPGAATGPQTAPPQPDNIDALKNALSDWGEEM